MAAYPFFNAYYGGNYTRYPTTDSYEGCDEPAIAAADNLNRGRRNDKKQSG